MARRVIQFFRNSEGPLQSRFARPCRQPSSTPNLGHRGKVTSRDRARGPSSTRGRVARSHRQEIRMSKIQGNHASRSENSAKPKLSRAARRAEARKTALEAEAPSAAAAPSPAEAPLGIEAAENDDVLIIDIAR